MKSTTLIILGAGSPISGKNPAALNRVGSKGRVLDWILSAFEPVHPNVFFVGGYQLQDIVSTYPEINFAVNAEWQTTGAAGSLFSASLPIKGDLYVCYSDVIFRGETVLRLQEVSEDLVLGIDTKWRTRYSLRSETDVLAAEKVRFAKTASGLSISREMSAELADAEFIGLVKFGEKAVKALNVLKKDFGSVFSSWDLPQLVSHLIESDLTVETVDVSGDWAELNDPQDLAHFILGTKAESLERLRPLVKKSQIGLQVSTNIKYWREDATAVINEIIKQFGDKSLVVRSSARTEDGWLESNAGSFVSKLNVLSQPDQIRDAINEVIASYGDENPGHQILVQAVLEGVDKSGVVTTRGLGRGAPYYTINFEESGLTNTVTSGSSGSTRTIVVHRSGLSKKDKWLESILFAIREIEELLGYDALDIEFATTKDEQIHILQVRPLVVHAAEDRPSDKIIEIALNSAAEFYKRRQKNEPWVLGDRAIFGVMPDWNPAEIVGTNPRPLALSLYQFLITDDVWARQRAEFGYRDVRPQPLLVSFVGHPYVDTRASFTSFVPAGISDDLANRLLNFYLARLESKPIYHDKVEFEVAFTCLYFDFDSIAGERLGPAGFSQKEIAELKGGMREVTRTAFGHFKTDLARIKELEQRYAQIRATELASIDLCFALLQDCKEYGTLPFAHLARGGFVAITLLRSLIRKELITAELANLFLNSLNTVTKQFEVDGHKVASNILSLAEFIEAYGHLRPGTYEITSQSYSQDPELYLLPMVKAYQESGSSSFEWPEEIREKISLELADLGLDPSFEHFDLFLRQAISGREFSKFVFSRNLSAALEAIADFGAQHGLNRDEMSFIDLEYLLSFRHSAARNQISELLRDRSDQNRSLHNVTENTILPPLITSENDLWSFEIPESHPNFVSLKRVVAPVIALKGIGNKIPDLKDRIVLIPQADPGYDWLFGRGISGLVTAYGGANSHMTIRAAELGLPAAIGVGEIMLSKLSAAKIVELDCKSKRINIVQ